MIYMKYGPYICIGVVLLILFVIWAFWGGKEYEFIGLAPLDPNTRANFTGSIYNWGNDPIPESIACGRESVPVDNTPAIPTDFHSPNVTRCVQESPEVQPVEKRGRFVSRGERLCCQTMEKIYGVPFKTIRPGWLRNPETNRPLELDCYNDDLQIGVEYNGEQHYKWPNFTNQSYDEFINQTRRDELKRNLCDRNGVYLIIVPYNVPHEMIESYIISHLPETIRQRIHEESVHN